MHHVDAHVGRTHLPDEGVEVRAVEVEERSLRVDAPGDLEDLLLEDAERVRNGDHQGRDVLVQLRVQRGEVHRPPRRGVDLHHLVAGEVRRGRVRAVSRVGDEDVAACVPPRHVGRPDHQRARQLAVRAGRGLERDARKAGEDLERLLEAPHHLEVSLREVLRGVGVRLVEPREARRLLVQPRVVLHRARAERVERRVDGEVQPREAREVPDDVHLGGFHLPAHLGAVSGAVERTPGRRPERRAAGEGRPAGRAGARRRGRRCGGGGRGPGRRCRVFRARSGHSSFVAPEDVEERVEPLPRRPLGDGHEEEVAPSLLLGGDPRERDSSEDLLLLAAAEDLLDRRAAPDRELVERPAGEGDREGPRNGAGRPS